MARLRTRLAVQKRCGKLHLVDLAGSENCQESVGDTGHGHKETAGINSTLFNLSRVITQLKVGPSHHPSAIIQCRVLHMYMTWRNTVNDMFEGHSISGNVLCQPYRCFAGEGAEQDGTGACILPERPTHVLAAGCAGRKLPNSGMCLYCRCSLRLCTVSLLAKRGCCAYSSTGCLPPHTMCSFCCSH